MNIFRLPRNIVECWIWPVAGLTVFAFLMTAVDPSAQKDNFFILAYILLIIFLFLILISIIIKKKKERCFLQQNVTCCSAKIIKVRRYWFINYSNGSRRNPFRIFYQFCHNEKIFYGYSDLIWNKPHTNEQLIKIQFCIENPKHSCLCSEIINTMEKN